MKTRFLTLLLFCLGPVALAVITAHAEPADDARYVARVMLKLDAGVEKARTHRDMPAWFEQCKIDLGELEEAIKRLPEPDRALYLAKVKVLRPEVEAGVRLSRGMNLARRIRSTLDSAKEDLVKMPVDESIFESLDRQFADPDAKGIPADLMKTLQTDYADLKKENAQKKAR